MSDLDSYLTHCYDLLLQKKAAMAEDEELCACSRLVENDNVQS
jgi:hypothetical protein